MRIVHVDGKWFLNSGWYAFTDPETGVTFQPGEITRARGSTWIKGQPTIREVADPLAKSATQQTTNEAPNPTIKSPSKTTK